MRLTLRTLLAYLDDTLEPRDVATLRQKLADSGFATQLVQRIRAKLVDPSLIAPPPSAVGPLQDANVISEYLDSTLPAEQLAEIERACLESDPNLAEVAACHQILTMVLGQPADVAPALRQRIYELPENEIEKIAARSETFSSIKIEPPAPPSGMGGASGPSTQAPVAPFSAPPAATDGFSQASTTDPVAGPPKEVHDGNTNDPVTPVGPADSGVTDAPKRLRESGVMDEEEDLAVRSYAGKTAKEAAIAGGRPLATDDSSMPWRRIASVLISLGLAAATVLMVLQIFKPLISGDKLAYESSVPETGSQPIAEVVEIPVPAGQVDTELNREIVSSPADQQLAESLPMPDKLSGSDVGLSETKQTPRIPLVDDPAASLRPDAATGAVEANAGSQGSDQVVIPPTKTEMATDDKPATDGAEPATGDASTENPEPAAGSSERTGNVAKRPAPERASPDPSVAAAIAPTEALVPSVPEPTIDASEGDTPVADSESVVGLIDAAASITTLLDLDGNWLRVGTGGWAMTNTPFVVAPKFKATMVAFPSSAVDVNQASQEPLAEREADYTVDLIGPVGVRWLKIENAEVEADPDSASVPPFGIEVDFGQFVISASKPARVVPIKLANATMEVTLVSEDTVIAVRLLRLRKPGSDPFDAANHRLAAELFCAAGEANVRHNGQKMDLIAGQMWRLREDQPPTVAAIDTAPAWIDAEESKLDQNAKSRLMRLLDKDTPVEASLREATHFRQSEVAALAAQALLTLGQSDVFFGSDGILYEPKQRQYWSDHFDMLVSTFDRNVESATLVRDSVVNKDAANADQIIELLTGYSQDQLENGSDEELVEYLDAESMAVRVLAIKNLQTITGGTLFYRAEEPVAARRADAIKKWQVRLTRGLIRWKES